MPDTQKPTAPGNLQATAGSGQVELSWQASTDNVGVTGYQVYRGAEQIANVGANATAYTDTNLHPGPYSYTVRAVDAAGNPSDFSNTASATVLDTTKPACAAEPDATASDPIQVDLAWDESTDDVAVTGYRVYRDDQQVDESPGTSYSDTVTARRLQLHGAGAGRRRQPLGPQQHRHCHCHATRPGGRRRAPANLTATVTGDDVDLDWEAATDNVEVTGYRVYRDDQLIATIDPATSYTDTGVAPGSYSYTVRALDAAGNRSEPSNAADATVLDTAKPTAPENLEATAVSPSQIDLSWDAAADNVTVTGYEIYRDDELLTTHRPGDLVLGRRDCSGHAHLCGPGAGRGRQPVRPEQSRDGHRHPARPRAPRSSHAT